MSAPALHELQSLFWRALQGGIEPALDAVVGDGGALTGRQRLGIYAGMYLWRLRDVLADDFEKTAAVLGPERFTDVSRDYLRRHPSEHPSVRHVGRHFAGFLEQNLPAGSPPWLPDLARLEWARVEVFDAPDATPLRREHLAAVPPDEWGHLVLTPVPALEVVESAWPVQDIWRDGGAPPPAPTAVRVWRQDGVVYHCGMDALEAEAVARLRSGATFGQVCEALAHLEPEAAAAEAGALVMRWIEDDLLVAPR